MADARVTHMEAEVLPTSSPPRDGHKNNTNEVVITAEGAMPPTSTANVRTDNVVRWIHFGLRVGTFVFSLVCFSLIAAIKYDILQFSMPAMTLAMAVIACAYSLVPLIILPIPALKRVRQSRAFILVLMIADNVISVLLFGAATGAANMLPSDCSVFGATASYTIAGYRLRTNDQGKTDCEMAKAACAFAFITCFSLMGSFWLCFTRYYRFAL